MPMALFIPTGASGRPYALVMSLLFVVAAVAALKPGPYRPPA